MQFHCASLKLVEYTGYVSGPKPFFNSAITIETKLRAPKVLSVAIKIIFRTSPKFFTKSTKILILRCGDKKKY